jgi:hypothetical protein
MKNDEKENMHNGDKKGKRRKNQNWTGTSHPITSLEVETGKGEKYARGHLSGLLIDVRRRGGSKRSKRSKRTGNVM